MPFYDNVRVPIFILWIPGYLLLTDGWIQRQSLGCVCVCVLLNHKRFPKYGKYLHILCFYDQLAGVGNVGEEAGGRQPILQQQSHNRMAWTSLENIFVNIQIILKRIHAHLISWSSRRTWCIETSAMCFITTGMPYSQTSSECPRSGTLQDAFYVHPTTVRFSHETSRTLCRDTRLSKWAA